MFVPHSDVDLKKIFDELSIDSLSDLLEFDIRGNFIEGNIINKRFLS